MSERILALLRELGLDSAELRRLPDVGPTPGDEELGFVDSAATVEAEGLSALLRARIVEEPDFSPSSALAAMDGLTARRWDVDPSVWLLAGLGAPVMAEGRVELAGPGEWLVDGRSTGAFVATRLGRQLVMFEAADGHLETHHCPFPPAPSWEPGPLSPGAATPDIDALAPATLLDEETPPAWLSAEADALFVSGGSLAQLASMGLLARMGSALSSDPKSRLKAVLAGEQSLASRVRSWVETVPAADREVLEFAAVGEAETLCVAVAELSVVVAADPDAGGVEAQRLRRWRDDLESVRTVLLGAAECPHLNDSLGVVDDLAAVEASAFAAATSTDEDDPRLSTVAWIDPDAWWGLHAS